MPLVGNVHFGSTGQDRTAQQNHHHCKFDCRAQRHHGSTGNPGFGRIWVSVQILSRNPLPTYFTLPPICPWPCKSLILLPGWAAWTVFILRQWKLHHRPGEQFHQHLRQHGRSGHFGRLGQNQSFCKCRKWTEPLWRINPKCTAGFRRRGWNDSNAVKQAGAFRIPPNADRSR